MYLSPAKRNAIRHLVLSDYLSAALSWCTFWIYRQSLLTHVPYAHTLEKFYSGDYVNTLIIVPLGWLLLYLLSGTYFDLYRKSRLNEVNRTLISCIIGCTMVSVIVFGNDTGDYSYFTNAIGHYLFIHTIFTLSFRLLLLYRVKVNLVKGRIGYNTLIIGG
ncbi:MAG: hypothetical protein EBZ77_03695, partial [Chitinophagia bacterium]|nr:hypothetical protein [Chitinophagia bacterium]